LISRLRTDLRVATPPRAAAPLASAPRAYDDAKLQAEYDRWVRPEEFVELREEALAMGFAGVLAGPLVRSSYRAGRLYAQAMEQRAIAAR